MSKPGEADSFDSRQNIFGESPRQKLWLLLARSHEVVFGLLKGELKLFVRRLKVLSQQVSVSEKNFSRGMKNRKENTFVSYTAWSLLSRNHLAHEVVLTLCAVTVIKFKEKLFHHQAQHEF